jgi:transposase InsO family protein
VTVVDEFSHFVAVLVVKSKDQISEELINIIRLWENQLRSRVKCVRSDRGTEFLNSRFKSFCAEQGIVHETSAPYTPQQNGVAERMNRSLKEKTSSLLHQAAATQALWKEALGLLHICTIWAQCQAGLSHLGRHSGEVNLMFLI